MTWWPIPWQTMCSLLFYYSMDRDRDWTSICVAVQVYISFVCFVILTAAGWAFAIAIHPGNPLMLAGAVVSTVPITCFIAFPCTLLTCGFCCVDKNKRETMGNLIFLIEILLGVCEFIGGVLFIAAGVTLNADPLVITLGGCTIVFGIIVVTCSLCFCCKRNQQLPENERFRISELLSVLLQDVMTCIKDCIIWRVTYL